MYESLAGIMRGQRSEAVTRQPGLSPVHLEWPGAGKYFLILTLRPPPVEYRR